MNTVLSKLLDIKRSDSELQFRDARHMLKGLNNLDLGYLMRWSQQLGIRDFFDKARG